MVDVSNKHKSITVGVSSNNGNTIVAAKSDTAQYWANQSHTFADQAKESVQEAKNYAELANSYIEGFENVVTNNTNNIIATGNDYINQITELKDVGIQEINESVASGKEEINSTKTTILNDIEFVADGEKKEIEELADLIKENAEEIANRTSFAMFDTILKDHVLTYEESKGLALQGTYVYKEALAGSRYGYPDFYNKCLEERNTATATEVTLGSSTITMYMASNGHQYYDIANKDVIDTFYNTMGSAWFYGVDTENERIFLPRNNYFDQATGDTSEVGKSIEAGLPNITGTAQAFLADAGKFNGALYNAGQYSKNHQGSSTGTDITIGIDASLSNQTYGNSDTVQPNAVKKLLYICVGNTTNYESMTEVVNQGMEILEQVNQGIETRVNLDATNISNDGKSLIAGFGMPSSRYVDLTIGATNSEYIAPANGWYCFCVKGGNSNYHAGLHNMTTQFRVWSGGMTIGNPIVYLPVLKGQTVSISYATSEKVWLRFFYAVGSESEV